MISRAALRLVRARPATLRPTTRTLTPLAAYPAIGRPFSLTATLQKKKKQPPPQQSPESKESSTAQEPIAAGAPSESQPTEPKPETSKSETQPDTTPEGTPEGTPNPFPLPDLTQGIPSTLEYETAGATRSSLTALPGESTRRELPDSAYISSTDRKRESFAKWSFITFLVASASALAYMGRDWDTDEEAAAYPDAPNGLSPVSMWRRAVARTTGVVTYFSQPAFETLLPKVDPMLEKPYTLCISLEDMLVHSEWSREHGWRVAKRPGVDYFLRYLSQYYELVLFTTVSSAVALPVIQKLDPFQMIMFPLFREATKYKDGEFVKDLSYLNRDLSKVIMLDTNPAHVSAQPENAIILPKWTGDKQDDGLVSLIPFLEYIHTMQYGDVRKVLKSFEGKDIPAEFARREAIARAEFQKQVAAKKKASTSKSAGGLGFLGGMLGLKPSNMSMMVGPEGEQNPGEAFAEGKMIQDIARERGQRYVAMLEADIKENGERYLKEQQAMMEQQQQEAMDSMMGSFSGMFGPGGKQGEKPQGPQGGSGQAKQ